MKKLVIVLGVIIIVLLGVLFFYNPAQGPTTSPSTASQPSTQPVVSADGHLTVNSLTSGQLIVSPLTITGNVVGGGWFNEGTFPVKIADADGRILGSGVAQAQADWESTGTVPFTAIINFSGPRFATGTVLLSKDNPSGAPANAAIVSIPVRFQ